MKLLYLPNETELDNKNMQIGPRKAFQHLLDEGELTGIEIFSFLYESKKCGNYREVRDKIISLAKEFQPDIIFWQHIDYFEINDDFIQELLNIDSKPKLIYHEADPYGRYIKRINNNMRVLFRHSDAVFMVGLGIFADLAKEAGAKRVYFAPHNFETVRSGSDWIPTSTRENELVMIANAIGYVKVPGRYFPGSQRRIDLGKKLSKRFGKQFALYGKGWDGLEASRGKLPFDQQEQAIHSAWLSINWDHFDEVPFYFSNRLPISLAAGVVHVTTWHPGYDQLFRDCKGGLYAAKSVDEAVELAQYLLSQPRDFLIEEGQKGKEFVFNHLEANIVYGNIIKLVMQELF
jgi:spore maturation protein CgeB